MVIYLMNNFVDKYSFAIVVIIALMFYCAFHFGRWYEVRKSWEVQQQEIKYSGQECADLMRKINDL